MSGIFLLVRRNLGLHKLSTSITVIATGLACALALSVFAIADQTRNAFTATEVGFDGVLGARGSELQIVLNTIFHLETSTGNIPFSLYREMRKDRRVKYAIPFATGDNYKGFRIVGTSEELWTKVPFFQVQSPGRFFHGQRREAVIGSFVSARTGLGINDVFHPYHGAVFDPSQRHAEEYVVTGVLEPTNTPADRAIWVPIEGIWRMEGHVLRGAGTEYVPQPQVPIPDEHKEVSSIGIRLRAPMFGPQLAQDFNRRGTRYTFALVTPAILSLFNKLFWFVDVLRVVAWLVVAVATGAILASIYNTMNERRREFAILRALGASRRTVWTSIVLESSTIALLGAVLGFALYAGIFGFSAALIRSRTGVVLEILSFNSVFVWIPLGMVLLGAVAGVIPAYKAYATDVAPNLR
ncbi:MAG: ABC transporter permease [Planctomycetota bacterium]